MRTSKEYRKCLNMQKGKTIGIVYIFRGENALGYKHYECWEGDVISSWIHAVEEIGGLPLIMDARTFCEKAMNGTLPHLDYVINLNNGTYDISVLGLVTSVCAFLKLPCIQGNTLTTVTGDNKQISNMLAEIIGIKIPNNMSKAEAGGIVRPIGLGSSIGVRRIKSFEETTEKPDNSCLYQEFIEGFDFTTPLLYDPISSSLSCLPAVMYIPDSTSPDWFLGEIQKREHSGYKKTSVRIQKNLSDLYVCMAHVINVSTYCRIDARFRCKSIDEVQVAERNGIPFEKAYFMEINPMPTIKNNINFCTSVENLTDESPFYFAYSEYMDFHYGCGTSMGFILSCSIQSIEDAIPKC